MTRGTTDPAISADELRLSIRGEAVIAHPTVEIDLSTAEPLGERIAEETPAAAPGVVLDLSDVGFIDSFGIYVIIGLAKQLAERDQSLALVVPKASPVLSTLRISNVDAHLEILAGVEEALTVLGSGRSRAAWTLPAGRRPQRL